MANAPPPEEFQFMLMYFCHGMNVDSGVSPETVRTPDEETTFVSQALLVTLRVAMPCSFLAGWPKTCLCQRSERDLVQTRRKDWSIF